MLPATIRIFPVALLLALAITFMPTDARNASRDFADHMSALETQLGGTVGVYALNTGTGETLAWREDERFAMASTFKPLVCAAILVRAERRQLSLDDEVSVDGVEIQSHSPVVGALEDGETITIRKLCEAAVTISDNTATNLLLEMVGGPEGLTEFLRHSGDRVTRLDRYELELNSNLRGDPRDTTTPRAMAKTLERLLFSKYMGAYARQLLEHWLVSSRTGHKRLRAGLPAEWRAGDKTGHGMNGAVNNIAVAWPPDGPPLVIAVYMSWTEKDVATLNAIHARIAAMAVQQLYRRDRKAPSPAG